MARPKKNAEQNKAVEEFNALLKNQPDVMNIVAEINTRLAKLEAIVFNNEYVTKKHFDRIFSIQNVTIAELIKKVIELEQQIKKD